MKNEKKRFTLFLLIVLFSFLTGCSSTTPEKVTLDGPTKEAILAYSEAKIDALLAGLNGNDYAMFSQDFDSEMLKGMSESAFETFKVERDIKIGGYISREIKSVIQEGQFYGVNYEAIFEKDRAVKMLVIFSMTEPHQISGLWFDK